MNGVSDKAQAVWKRNGWGVRIAAIALLFTIFSGTLSGGVWFVYNNAWASDIMRVANAGEARSNAQTLRIELRLNEIRRQQIEAQLRQITAREKHEQLLDGDSGLAELLRTERSELLGEYIELRREQRKGQADATN